MVWKILIVDDDADFLCWMKFGFSQRPEFKPILAQTLKDGWNIFCQESPDIILLDMKLPDGNGIELCRMIRTRMPDIPILLITGVFNESEASMKGSALGVNDILIKPFGYEKLLQKIYYLLKSQNTNKNENKKS